MIGIINPENLKMSYDRFQSVPTMYGNNGFEILVTGVEGKIETNGFKGVFDEGSFKDDKLYHFVLEIPDDLRAKMGVGNFVIELEVDTRDAEDWEEEVLLHFLSI